MSKWHPDRRKRGQKQRSTCRMSPCILVQGLGLQVENLGLGEPNTSKDEPDLLKISVLRKSYILLSIIKSIAEMHVLMINYVKYWKYTHQIIIAYTQCLLIHRRSWDTTGLR